jgi:hypothetical protein
MKDNFTKNAVKAFLLILGLLVLEGMPALARHTQRLNRVAFIVWEMHNGRLNADDYHALAAGYYEGIEHVDRISKDNVDNADYRLRDDFLRFELKPHLNRETAAGKRFTNSFGMANPEYGYAKPPHTRRIAWLGDSVSVGPYGRSFEMLLENRLNQTALTPEIEQFQVLNFSVLGYVLLQEMDVALEKAPKFHPDVYVVALTSQEIVGSRKHVGRLVVRGTDLKYDFLRRIAAQAGVRPDDHLNTVVVKLKPFFDPLTRQALEQIRDHAARQGARMIIVLVPVPIEPSVTDEDFDNLRPAVDAVGVPVIDLRDTFRSVNLKDVQVVPEGDIHPNALGHKMIYESLYSHLRAQPDAWAVLTGNDGHQPDQSPRH